MLLPLIETGTHKLNSKKNMRKELGDPDFNTILKEIN